MLSSAMIIKMFMFFCFEQNLSLFDSSQSGMWNRSDGKKEKNHSSLNNVMVKEKFEKI